MSGGTWNRAGRRSGGSKPTCIAVGAMNADDVVKAAIGRVVEIEHERGIKIDWLAELPDGVGHSARDVINAIGRALTRAGVGNNLAKEPTNARDDPSPDR